MNLEDVKSPADVAALSDADLSAAQASLGKLGNIARQLAGADSVVQVLAGTRQAVRESEAAALKFRGEVARGTTEIFNLARKDAEKEASRIVARAEEAAAEIQARAAERVTAADKEVAQRQDETRALEARIAALRSNAKAELGALLADE